VDKLIVLDYDGVVVDSLRHNLKVAKACADLLGVEEFPATRDVRQMRQMTFESLGRLLGLSERDITEFRTCIFRRLTTATNAPPLYPGMASLIRDLSQAYVLAIVTDNAQPVVRGLLGQHDLLRQIALIEGGENQEPKSTKIEKLISRFAIDRNDAFFVGDSVSDIRAAKAAGVKSIAVTYGFQYKDLLAREDPDVMVRSPAELRALFDRM